MSELDDFELGLIDVDICSGKDIEVWNIQDEFSSVNAGIGNNIENTKELKVSNYCEAMKSKDAD